MHEYYATQAIVDAAVEAAAREGATRVVSLDLVIGELADISNDSVQFYFDMLSKGTPVEGAQLNFRREPAAATCGDCGHTFEVTEAVAQSCPQCGSMRVQLDGGTKTYLEGMEIDRE